MYHYMDHKEAYALLYQAGFSHLEIDRLTRFRRHFVAGELDCPPTERRRLEFMRWLFQMGKLTESTDPAI